MKKLLYILLFVPVALFGQTVEDFSLNFPNPEATGFVNFTEGTLTEFAGGLIMPYIEDVPVGPAQLIYSDGFTVVSAFGCNYCNYLASNGDELQFVILHNSETIVIADIDTQVTFFYDMFETHF